MNGNRDKAVLLFMVEKIVTSLCMYVGKSYT